jgi:hypothetical protein
MLPPGRLKLATSPAFTGSVPLTVTIGIEEVAAFAERAATSTAGDDHGDLLAHQVSREHRQSIVLALRPTKFNRHVLTVDITRLVQTFAKAGNSTRIALGDPLLRNPITGLADCCARATSAHAPAAPGNIVMNSRRLIRPLRHEQPASMAVMTVLLSHDHPHAPASSAVVQPRATGYPWMAPPLRSPPLPGDHRGARPIARL